jgi:hypothetical protein
MYADCPLLYKTWTEVNVQINRNSVRISGSGVPWNVLDYLWKYGRMILLSKNEVWARF